MSNIVSGVIAFWARNPVAANLLMCMAFAGGVAGYLFMEKESFPSGNWNGVEVSVSWPGATPREIEEQVVIRIEEVVADLDGMDNLVSVSRENGASVYIETKSSVNTDKFLDQVKRRVDSVNNLPVGSYRPIIRQMRRSTPYMGVVLYGDIDLLELKRTIDKVRDEMARLPGGEISSVLGVLDEEVTIELSERAMQRYGLDFDTVARAVRASSINGSGGKVRADSGSVSLQVRSLADTREQFENIVVRQNADGGLIRVKDVAGVKDAFADRDLNTRYRRVPAAFIFFDIPEQMDLPKYHKALTEYVENKELPEALNLVVMWSDNDFMSRMIGIISSSAFLGILMVLLLLMLFLRPLVAFWVAVGIATAFTGGFALLPGFGVSLNILALFGCLLVIGVVVDDAIIIGENIHSEIEKARLSRVEAVIEATTRVSKPVIFGVLTTMIAFAPWALLTGPEQQFTKHLTLTVTAALIFSLIEAFCILPNHLSHMKPQSSEGRFGKFQQRIAASLLWFADRVYRPVILGAIKFRYVTIAVFASLLMLALGLAFSGFVRSAFLPDVEADVIHIKIDLPDGTPFSRVLGVRDRLEKSIDVLGTEMEKQYPKAREKVVEGASVVAYGHIVESWLPLSDSNVRPKDISTKAVSGRLREIIGPIEDAEEVLFEFGPRQVQSESLRFSLRHGDIGVLQAAALDFRQHFARYPAASDIGDNMSSPGEEMRFSLKPGAEALGIGLADVVRQVRQAYHGEEVQRLPRNGEDVRVMVKLPERDRRSLDSLRDLRIRTPDGRQIPLPQLVDIEFVPGIDHILRRDRQRSITVFATVEEEFKNLVAGRIHKEFLPELLSSYPGLRVIEIGERQDRIDFFREVVFLQLVAFAVMYVLLAVAFGSYVQPFLIMTAIPFGIAGAIFGHWVFGLPIAIFSMFGMAAAAGIVINDNLVLLDQVNHLRERGAGVLESLVEAAVGRFRPVFLTSLTTVVGIFPMLLDQSVQGQFLKPMVLSMASAVGFALFVTLLLVPALYAASTDMRRIFAWVFLGRPYRNMGHASYTREKTQVLAGE